MDRLRHSLTRFPYHLLNISVFDGNQTVLFDDFPCQFPLEVAPLVSDLLVDTGDFGFCLRSILGTAPFSRKLLLSFRQSLFGLPEPARVLDLSLAFSIRDRRKAVKAGINTHFAISLRPLLGRDLVARKARIPMTGSGSFDGASLRISLNGTVKLDPDFAYPREIEPLLGNQIEPILVLWVDKTGKPAPSLETRIARFFSVLDSPEEALERLIESVKNLLKNLGVYFFVLRTKFLHLGKLIGLLPETDRDLPPPSFFSLFKTSVIEFP